jgi:membrane carboxypeptidase/penicillin-binding protein PbpC
MREFWRKRLIDASFTCAGNVCALAAADRANPPDMTSYNTLSPEVVASNCTLLRPFLSIDGYWRL